MPAADHPRRRLLAGTVVLLLVLGLAVAVVYPFAGTASTGGSRVGDNGVPTGLRTVQRRSLTSQQPVSGTLGYAGSRTVAVPAGTPATDLQQAAQQKASALASYSAAQAAASNDGDRLAAATGALHASELKQASDCGGTSAASACRGSMQAAAADQETVATARRKAASDRAQLAGARTTLASARQALTSARSASSSYGSSATYTMLPAAGEIIRRGHPLYAINASPTLLLDGSTPAWRAFVPGMSPGADVAELNANLRALGYADPGGDAFTSATERAIAALQRAHGLAVTSRLLLGSVAFEPAPVRVRTVTTTVGQAVQPGPIMTLSSTKHDVSVQLDASQQSQVKVGDRVQVTLPDNRTTPGVVFSVGKVATTPPSSGSNSGAGGGGNGSSSPTVEVEVRLLHPAGAGTLDQAPVNVLITTASVRHALVVPVNALVALAGGGYAVEELRAGGVHQLVAVNLGLFDDAEGIVQITGSGIAAGQRVVVPAQ
jgi:hypothetical protein